MPRRTWQLTATVGLSAAVLIIAAGADAATGKSTASPGRAVARWTPADVLKASKPYHVIPIYNVPKKLPKYLLAFINPDLGNPFFKSWQSGMKAAAKFYGVRFIDADAQNNYDSETSLYDLLNAQHPNAVGAHPGNDVIAQNAYANHQPFTSIDGYGGSQKALSGGIGIPDAKAGQLAASGLVPFIKQRVAGAWKGKQLYFLGLGVPGCAPCEIRPHVAYDSLKGKFHFADAAYTPSYADPNFGQKWMTDQLTAHPDGRFVIVPLNDESLIGVLQALKSAGKLDNALAVTMGSDSTGRGFMTSYPKTVVNGIDFNPFSEGWNWVVASIARLQHAHYSQYQLSPVLTPATVNKAYPPGTP